MTRGMMMPQKKVLLANYFTLKELSGALHIDIERAKAEMLEAGPLFERSIIICRGGMGRKSIEL